MTTRVLYECLENINGLLSTDDIYLFASKANVNFPLLVEVLNNSSVDIPEGAAITTVKSVGTVRFSGSTDKVIKANSKTYVTVFLSGGVTTDRFDVILNFNTVYGNINIPFIATSTNYNYEVTLTTFAFKSNVDLSLLEDYIIRAHSTRLALPAGLSGRFSNPSKNWEVEFRFSDTIPLSYNASVYSETKVWMRGNVAPHSITSTEGYLQFTPNDNWMTIKS